MIWDTAFEGTPTGSDFASVTSKKLRDLSSLFKEMLSKEHTFDESDNPVMTHKLGYCSVIGIDIEDYEIAENGIGEKDGIVKHNNGTVLSNLGTTDHRELTGLLDSDTHTQYVKKAEPVFNDVTLDDIENVEVPTYPNVGEDNEIMSRAAHKPDSLGDEGAHHADGIISNVDITASFSSDKIALKENLVGNGTSVVYTGGGAIGSVNCFYVDTNYKCYLDPIIDGSNGIKISCDTSGDITVDTIEE